MRALANTLWGEEHGYSLVELLVVMVILSAVFAGLTTVFVSGSTAEVSLNQRFQAQQQARLALDRIRGDIHCASHALAGASATINSLPALRLNVVGCSAAQPYDYWCVTTVSASPPHYQLWRTTSAAAPTASTCTSSDASRRQIADYLVSSSVFTTNTVPQFGLQTVGVSFEIAVNPTTTNQKDLYGLTDAIVARNYTPRCTNTSPTWDVGTSTCSLPSVP